MNHKIKKIEYEDEIYYITKEHIVDGSFTVVSEELSKKIADKYFAQFNYKELDKEELLNYIKDTKQFKCYVISLEACRYFSVKYSDHFAILSIETSLLRLLNKPNEAIELAERFLRISKNYGSIPLLTSLATAYCDVENYIKAKQYCDYAFAKQGGSVGYTNELSLVYLRVKKELANKE
jgi:tetratricopeptide (TPR) repeat protein